MTGISVTWWRSGSGSRPWRWPPQARQTAGRSSFRSSFWSTATSSRMRRLCPDCPPGLRPDGGFLRRITHPGSEDGGLEEFVEFWLSWALSCATWASSSAIRPNVHVSSASRSPMRAMSAGSRSHSKRRSELRPAVYSLRVAMGLSGNSLRVTPTLREREPLRPDFIPWPQRALTACHLRSTSPSASWRAPGTAHRTL